MHFLQAVLFCALCRCRTWAFSMSPSSSAREIYGVAGSGWTSPTWNWGSPQGTGHDCAMICRDQYDTPENRAQLIQSLLLENEDDPRLPENFEEVKLVLALAWQGYRTMSIGQRTYGDVLDAMVAQNFEKVDEKASSKLLVQEMQKRFTYLLPEVEDKIMMNTLLYETEEDHDLARRRCSGLVLKAMDFVDYGL